MAKTSRGNPDDNPDDNRSIVSYITWANIKKTADANEQIR